MEIMCKECVSRTVCHNIQSRIANDERLRKLLLVSVALCPFRQFKKGLNSLQYIVINITHDVVLS